MLNVRTICVINMFNSLFHLESKVNCFYLLKLYLTVVSLLAIARTFIIVIF